MNWFTRSRKSKVELPLSKLCYDLAYFILPAQLKQNAEHLIGTFRDDPSNAGRTLYTLVCVAHQTYPDSEIEPEFRLIAGVLSPTVEQFTLIYPTPPAVDFSNMSMDDFVNAKSPPVLAPFFSTVLVTEEAPPEYYILGQSPMGGGTTLRCITSDGVNANLGPGPEPVVDEFHAELLRRKQVQ